LIRNDELYKAFNAVYATKEEIYQQADIITLHVPLTNVTSNLITLKEMSIMKPSAKLINTSRGGIINEEDLYKALKQKLIDSAAIDVFDIEPYNGKLVELPNCYFTCHMGSMTKDCRSRMEIEATDEVVKYFNNVPLKNIVPEEEYNLRLIMKSN
jgi:D-3-phosphoglycerate dehydrogenase